MWFRILMAGFASLATMGGLYAALFSLVGATPDAQSPIIVHRFDFRPVLVDTPAAVVRVSKPERRPTEKRPEVPTIEIAAKDIPTSGPTPFQPSHGGGRGIPIGKTLPSTVGGIDTEVIPLVRIQPQYPPRALAGNTEGWVRCQFDITPAGAVVDALVIDSEPRGTFDRAALEAVSRWKYKPKVENGVAVERRGVQVLLTFKLDK